MIRLCATLLLLAAGASGINVTTLSPEGFVSDYARVLDPSAKRDLERYCAMIQRKTGAQIALVTLPTLEGDPVEDFANDLFRHWGIGKKGKDQGLLLLLVTGDRRSRLEVGRGLEPVLTDGASGELLREMRPALQAGQYGEALGTAAESLGRRIAAAKGVSLEGARPLQRVRDESKPGGFTWAMLAFLLPVLFLVPFLFRSRRRRGPPDFTQGFFTGSALSGAGSATTDSGGFGGYDSSDSFGGFGGGDSGGGGASSSW